MPTQRGRNAVKSSDRIANAQTQRFALRLAFDGTTYQGFQSQPHANTVQDQLEQRLGGVLQRPVRVHAWGRTDRGVHARGAVVTVDLSRDEVRRFAKRVPMSATDDDTQETKAARFLRSVRYPCQSGESAQSQQRAGSIVTSSVVPVRCDFDARYSSLWKRYVYFICAGADAAADQLPFAWSRYSWQITHALDLVAMVGAAASLSDREHNFAWLSVVQPGELRDPRRQVQLTVETMLTEHTADNTPFFLQRNETTVIYKVSCTCDFFLYNMMRRIVGVLVAVGKHDADLEELKICIDAHDSAEGPHRSKTQIPSKMLETAPAKGLCLDHIEYDPLFNYSSMLHSNKSS